MLLGKDEAAGLCDVMMVASFDTEAKTLSVMQIPRDTYLRYTEADYKKINGALRTLGDEKKLCQWLGEALGLSLDAYVSFDLSFLEKAVDLLGGVEIDVPFDMNYDDPYQGLSIHLKKGKQRLSGKEATQFVRYRAGYARGDIGRMDAQKLFAASLAKQYLESESDLTGAILLALQYVRTDLRVGQMIAMAGALRQMSADHMTILTLPGEEVQSSYSGAWYYVASRQGAEAAMRDFFDAVGTFDPKKLLTDRSRPDFHQIYEKNISPEVFTVSELLGGKLKIENEVQ